MLNMLNCDFLDLVYCFYKDSQFDVNAELDLVKICDIIRNGEETIVTETETVSYCNLDFTTSLDGNNLTLTVTGFDTFFSYIIPELGIDASLTQSSIILPITRPSTLNITVYKDNCTITKQVVIAAEDCLLIDTITEIDKLEFQVGETYESYVWTYDTNILELVHQTNNIIKFNLLNTATNEFTIGLTVTDSAGCTLDLTHTKTFPVLTTSDTTIILTGVGTTKTGNLILDVSLGYESIIITENTNISIVNDAITVINDTDTQITYTLQYYTVDACGRVSNTSMITIIVPPFVDTTPCDLVVNDFTVNTGTTTQGFQHILDVTNQVVSAVAMDYTTLQLTTFPTNGLVTLIGTQITYTAINDLFVGDTDFYAYSIENECGNLKFGNVTIEGTLTNTLTIVNRLVGIECGTSLTIDLFDGIVGDIDFNTLLISNKVGEFTVLDNKDGTVTVSVDYETDFSFDFQIATSQGVYSNVATFTGDTVCAGELIQAVTSFYTCTGEFTNESMLGLLQFGSGITRMWNFDAGLPFITQGEDLILTTTAGIAAGDYIVTRIVEETVNGQVISNTIDVVLRIVRPAFTFVSYINGLVTINYQDVLPNTLSVVQVGTSTVIPYTVNPVFNNGTLTFSINPAVTDFEIKITEFCNNELIITV